MRRVDVERFHRLQHQLYRTVNDQWPCGVADPYDLLAPVVISRRDADQLLAAASAVAFIYRKVAHLLAELRHEVLEQLGYSTALGRVCPLERVDGANVLARVDLVKTATGFKLLDFNADTPGLVFETAVVNGHACRLSGCADPNVRSPVLIRAAMLAAIRRASKAARIGRPAVVRCGYTDGAGQKALAQYLALACSRHCDARAVPSRSLRADDRGAYDESGNRIDVFIRCCPLGCLLRRSDFPGKTGRRLLRLAAEARLTVINPPQSYLLESKAVQALIWGLFERRLCFDRRERSMIGRHFLPTYFQPHPRWTRWVEKPFLKECGAGVSIRSRGRARSGDRPGYVYQQYVPVRRRRLMTELGPKSLTLIASCLLAGGRPAGLIMRAGPPVTDGSAWDVPVAVS